MRVHLIVHGSVQGVFYRASAQKEAEKLGLAGWARNNSSGSVEIVAEGLRTDLEKFVVWCRQGPSGADVENVDVEWEEATGEFKRFEIAY